MRNLRIHSVLGLLILAIVACTPKSKLPQNPTTSAPLPSSPLVQSTSQSDLPSLPDLIIHVMYLEMEGRQGYCVNAYSSYGIRVKIKNIGAANAGPFSVALNGNLQEVNYGLLVEQSIELHFPGTIPSGQYDAIVDTTDQVLESREDNNTSAFHAPTPTPPPLCPTTVTVTATP